MKRLLSQSHPSEEELFDFLLLIQDQSNYKALNTQINMPIKKASIFLLDSLELNDIEYVEQINNHLKECDICQEKLLVLQKDINAVETIYQNYSVSCPDNVIENIEAVVSKSSGKVRKIQWYHLTSGLVAAVVLFVFFFGWMMDNKMMNSEQNLLTAILKGSYNSIEASKGLLLSSQLDADNLVSPAFYVWSSETDSQESQSYSNDFEEVYDTVEISNIVSLKNDVNTIYEDSELSYYGAWEVSEETYSSKLNPFGHWIVEDDNTTTSNSSSNSL